MRCKKHYNDLSSINGVCASCLRQRLFSLIAAQSQQSQQSHLPENQPVFPRSVSPYITRRKSDNSTSSNNLNNNITRIISERNQRFFSTPQVGPTVTSYNNNNNNNNNVLRYDKKKNSFIRFSLLSNLFRSKIKHSDLDPKISDSVTDSVMNSATSSPSWFSNIVSKRKKQTIVSGEIRRKYCPDRGVSPARYSDYGEDEFYNASSGYESCDSRKQTPWRTPAHSAIRRGGGGGGGNGLTFCLSPLVRASPCRKKGISPAVDGGDIRAPVKPHLMNTKSFCANRSRKLADFGRFNTNR